jgi:two-component system sensor histidine kinase PilS (NtrC family)
MVSRNLRAHFDFSKTESQSFAIHSIRLAFLVVVLIFTLSFQLLESRIDANQVFVPLYILIGISFSLQLSFLLFFRSLHTYSWLTAGLFVYEVFYITGLIYFIGVQQSLLIFLYLVNLILCGILFQRKGALGLALWTSVMFSFIVSLDTSLSGNTAYLAVGVNNLAFFTVAYLSGFLSEQLNLMGVELKEKARDVATLKNLNELILRNMNSGLLTLDQNQSVLQANPAAQNIIGKSVEEIKSQSLVSLLPGLDLSTPPSNKEFDVQFKRNDEKRILSMTRSPLYDNENTLQGQIISFQDHTHMRALEKRVRQSEKMAAIGQLAAGIAHEIRNPLAGISGSIQLMQAGDSEPEQTAKLMGIVTKEIDRLNHLITEFLDFAKPEAPMEDRIDLAQLLEETSQFLKNDLGNQNLKIQTEFSENLIILGNRDKLRQAFLNIIVNAIQAMQDISEPILFLSVQKHGDLAWVSIKDKGMGIPEKIKDRIFEPFHTTKNKGTGLGLAITHSIVESHGADILVESEEGRGTEFRLSFKLIHPA